MRLAAVLALLGAAAGAAPVRLTIPFGNGWRFHYGDDPAGSGSGPGVCSFEDAVGLDCTFMETDPNRFTPEDCKIACCYSVNCTVWQQQDFICKHGDARSVCTPKEKMGEPPASPGPGGPKSPATGGLRRDIAPYDADYAFARADFDDAQWAAVAVPHDFLINGTFTETDDNRHAYLPRAVGWYRKRFVAPASGRSFLRFAGATHWKQIYLNGEPMGNHSTGYTPFEVPVAPGSNVISLRVDATFGSGHWYEGGGINRDVQLVNVPGDAWLAYGGVFIDPHSTGDAVEVSAEVAFPGDVVRGGADGVEVTFTLIDPDAAGGVLGTTTVAVPTGRPLGKVGRNRVATVSGRVLPTAPLTLWSPANPKLYAIVVSVLAHGAAVDEQTVTTGFRTVAYGVDGFTINGAVLPLQGFSHHDNFVGTGVVQPARLNLFMARTSRALGANFWRMSHNPYDDALYAILNAMGYLAWDEHRDFGMRYTDSFADMIRHHRSHAAVTTWSFCNEIECTKYLDDTTGAAMQRIAKALDPNRQTAANMIDKYKAQSPWSDVDVVGLSHMNVARVTKVHDDEPDRPLLLSECCSCESARVDVNARDATTPCMHTQNSPGVGLPFVTGSIGVWTLMDYFGEQHTWPNVQCDYGQFDGAGFPKAHAWYYRRNWRNGRADPAIAAADLGTTTCKITTLLDLGGARGSEQKKITGYIGTPSAVLYVDGERHGGVANATEFGAVSWAVENVAGVKNATLVGFAVDSSEALKCTTLRPGAPATLELIVDVPSASTGTGGALYLDGKDVALVRAQVVDARGVVVTDPAHIVNVTFAVTSGPAKLLGVGNGNTTNHQHSQGATVMTYAGLARGVLQVTLDCTTPHRDVASGAVDALAGPLVYASTCAGVPDITVTATVPDMPTAVVTIAVSGDAADAPLAVAKRRDTTYTYVDDIQA